MLGIDPSADTAVARTDRARAAGERARSVYTVRETVGNVRRGTSRSRTSTRPSRSSGWPRIVPKRLGVLWEDRSAGSTWRSGSSAIPISCSSTNPPRGSTRRRARTVEHDPRGLRDLGKTVVLTTHYMEEAQHLADRLAILRDGLVVGSGTPDELIGATAGRRHGHPLPPGRRHRRGCGAGGGRFRAGGVGRRDRAPERHHTQLYQLTSGPSRRRRAQGPRGHAADPRRRVPRAHRRSRQRSVSGEA